MNFYFLKGWHVIFYPLFRSGIWRPEEKIRYCEYLGKVVPGWKPLLKATAEHRSWHALKRHIEQFGIIIDEQGKWYPKYEWKHIVLRKTLSRKNKKWDDSYTDFEGFCFKSGWFK